VLARRARERRDAACADADPAGEFFRRGAVITGAGAADVDGGGGGFPVPDLVSDDVPMRYRVALHVSEFEPVYLGLGIWPLGKVHGSVVKRGKTSKSLVLKWCTGIRSPETSHS